MILDSFTMHPGVLWVNELTAPAVAQQIDRTILGNIYIYHNPISQTEVIIEARDSGQTARGYFTREQVEHLRTAENTGAVVVMQYRGVSYNLVVIAGGVQLTPKKEIEAVDTEDPYTGTVTFQRV